MWSRSVVNDSVGGKRRDRDGRSWGSSPKLQAVSPVSSVRQRRPSFSL